MLAARALLAGFLVVRLVPGADEEARRFAPSYASSSVVHAASQQSGNFAPNTIATLYGKDLAYVTRGLGADDVRDNLLPTIFSGTGVRLFLDGIATPLYFVSPQQVNFLVPANMKPGLHRLHLALDGRAGPVIEVRIGLASPGLFAQQPGLAIAVRVDGSLVGQSAPARPGEIIILFATGLGETKNSIALRPGEVARGASTLVDMEGFAVRLNGRAIPRDHIFYAGLAPGFAGLYQINLRVPEDAPADPEIRVEASGSASPDGVRLAVRRAAE